MTTLSEALFFSAEESLFPESKGEILRFAQNDTVSEALFFSAEESLFMVSSKRDPSLRSGDTDSYLLFHKTFRLKKISDPSSSR